MDAPISNEDGQRQKKRKVSFKRIFAILLVLAAIGLVISEATGTTQVLADLLNPPMHFVGAAYVTHEVGAAAQIHAADDGFFLATRDAMRFHNTDGAEVFRYGHVMGNPALFGRGNYAAIVEHGGRTFSVFNSQQRLYQIATDWPITRLALSPQGFVAVMMQTDRGIHRIEIFDRDGTMFYEGDHADRNILPILMDINHDASVLAIAYIDINDAEMNSFISFVSIDGSHVGADDIFAENRDNPGQIIGSMQFLADGSLAVVSDTRIFVLNSAATTVWQAELNNRVTHVAFADSWFAVAYGDIMLNRVGMPPGTVVAHNALGATQLFAHTLPGGVVRHMQMGGGHLVIGSGDGHFTALAGNGQAQWELTLHSNISDIGIMGNVNNVVSLTPTQTNVLHRVREN